MLSCSLLIIYDKCCASLYVSPLMGRDKKSAAKCGAVWLNLT